MVNGREFVIGEQVAIWQSGYGDSGNVTRATIERDTKLYWVADGRKFRKSDCREPGASGTWSRAVYLLPVDDEQVIKAETAARKRAAYGKLARAQDELFRDRENPERIEAVRAALDAYAKTLSN